MAGSQPVDESGERPSVAFEVPADEILAWLGEADEFSRPDRPVDGPTAIEES